MENTKKKKKLIFMIGSIILFIVCLVTTVYLNIQTGGQNIDESKIQKVKCTVTNVEEYAVRVNGTRITNYKCYATYNGKEYEVHNVIEKYKFVEGRTADVLLYKGKLYANMEGITSSTGLATVYFVFLFGTVGVFVLMINAIMKFCRKD